MITDNVKFFNATKGFGFNTSSDGSKGASVHIPAVEQAALFAFADGQTTYDLEDGRDGKTFTLNLQLA